MNSTESLLLKNSLEFTQIIYHMHMYSVNVYMMKVKSKKYTDQKLLLFKESECKGIRVCYKVRGGRLQIQSDLILTCPVVRTIAQNKD